MSNNELKHITPPSNDVEQNDVSADKALLDRLPEDVSAALSQPTVEASAQEIVNILNDAPVGTPVPIVEMDWA
jgi:hypothetical protein